MTEREKETVKRENSQKCFPLLYIHIMISFYEGMERLKWSPLHYDFVD